MARINNKDEREKAKREAHKYKQGLKRQMPVLERETKQIAERPKILIVCEGENTEKDYFEMLKRFFKLYNTLTIKIVGEGNNTLNLVKKAKKLNQQDEYEQVWCVFDKDDFPNKNFNEAIQIAESLGFEVAYSNQAFEYWLLLHFENHLGNPIHRDLYYDRINNYLKESKLEYDKDSKIITEEIFLKLQAIDPKTGKTRQDLAIERAKKIVEKWEKDDSIRSNPAKEESSTTVFRLVETLISYRKTN